MSASPPRPPDPERPPATMLGRLFVSFSSPDYRLVWSYFVLNFMGMSMEMLAQGWLVLVVTDSPFWVGGVAGLWGAGQVAFGVIGGVIVDRFNRRIIIAVVQVLRAAIFLTLGLLLIADSIQLWHLLVAALIQGMLMSTGLPAGEALIYDTVGPKRLLNAIAVKQGAFSLARIPGSILAGTLIDATGFGPCYMVITGVLLFSPLPVLLIKTRYRRPPAVESLWRNITSGLSYASRTSSLRSLLLFSTVVELFGFSYFVMLPVVARDVLHVEASGLGYLSAAGSVGGLGATVILAALANSRSKHLMLAVASTCVGIFLLLFGISSWYAVSLVLSGLVGGALAAYDATMGANLQLISSDAMRGRILGLYGLTFGFTPLGGFLSGVIATAVTASFAVGMGGVVILGAVSVMLVFNRSFREPAKGG